MDHYATVRKIGQGQFGTVELVERKRDGCKFVIKKIPLDNLTSKQQTDARNEVEFLKSLTHPGIVHYEESFSVANTLHIVMEYCEGGDLSSRIQRVTKPFPEEVILDWLVQIALALRSCHRLKILHRDLKTQNIFLTEDDYVKIGDFGIARVLTGTMDMAQTVVGTPYSMSPEVCQNKPYSFKSDMWSLGCVLYEVASRQNAFGGANLLAVVLKIVQEPHERLPECYSREFSKLVDDLLHKDPAKRLSIDDLLNRPLLADRIARVKHEQSTRARQLKKKRTLARLNRKVRPPTMDHLSAERDRENGGNASGQPNKFFRRRRSSAPAVGPFDQFAVPVSPEHAPADHVATEGARNSYDPSELYAALQRRRRGSVST
eukprot:428746_1